MTVEHKFAVMDCQIISKMLSWIFFLVTVMDFEATKKSMTAFLQVIYNL